MKTNCISFLFLILASSVFAQQNIPGSFIDDRDSIHYKTVTIGNQIWTAENLQFKIADGSWCYQNADSNCAQYGRYYTWDAALQACPSGWHLPSDAEWGQMETNLGVPADKLSTVGLLGTDVATQLKAGGNTGFNVLMAGYRLWWDGAYLYQGSYADFWTSTPDSEEEAWMRDFSIDNSSVFRNRINKKYGHSVRCIKAMNN
jgi:uncharacterized protein (TIGR02145 family)